MENNNIPDKFKNDDGTLNTESLLKSYSELEKKIGTMINIPTPESDQSIRDKFNTAIGIPACADEYPDDPMFTDAKEIKEKFLEIGLSKKQAEQIYKLASEFLNPVMGNIMSMDYENKSIRELESFFGGNEKLRASLSEINNYAEKNLPPDVYETLTSSVDGIKAIYKMMQSSEPQISVSGANNTKLNDSELRQMMKDPKYWRDHDDEFIRKIESGFKKLYA
jgi:hypothetical protein